MVGEERVELVDGAGRIVVLVEEDQAQICLLYTSRCV